MRVPAELLGILAVIIILATATGCDSGNGSYNQALTEIDFATNPSLRADRTQIIAKPSIEQGPLPVEGARITITL